MGRTIKLGLVNRGAGKTKDEAVSVYTIDSITAFFKTMSSKALEEIAKTNNALKTIKNYYINYNGQTGKYYTSEMTYFFKMNDIKANEFHNISNMSSNELQIVIHESKGTDTAKLLRPSGAIGKYGTNNPINLGVSQMEMVIPTLVCWNLVKVAKYRGILDI